MASAAATEDSPEKTAAFRGLSFGLNVGHDVVTSGIENVFCLIENRSCRTIVDTLGLGRRRGNNEAAVSPCHVRQPAHVGLTILRAAPRGIGREIKIALSYSVAIRVRTTLEVLALSPHWHARTLLTWRLAHRPPGRAELADRTLHLEFDQATPFDRVLHRESLGDWFDEAIDNHPHRLLFR